jgi:hypothetical protein
VEVVVNGFRLGVTLRGRDEAQVTVEGSLDSDSSAQVVTLVGALLRAGARQLFVDLAGVLDCDPGLAAYLERQRRHVASQGGWMVIDGGRTDRCQLDPDNSTLEEIFDIYRQVSRPPVHSG